MMRTFASAKIHHIHVTGKSLNYLGSASIDRDLLEQAGIAPYEQIQIVNLANGKRWITYALPAAQGVFTLNGGGARLGEIGDSCIVIAYQQSETFLGATVVYCTADNAVEEVGRYESA